MYVGHSSVCSGLQTPHMTVRTRLSRLNSDIWTECDRLDTGTLTEDSAATRGRCTNRVINTKEMGDGWMKMDVRLPSVQMTIVLLKTNQ